MAQMIFAGGGAFHLERNSHLQQEHKLDPSRVGVEVLSEISSVFRLQGYQMTTPKRSRRKGVKAQLILGVNLGIDLYVSPEDIGKDGCPFMIDGFGYAGKNDDEEDAEFQIMKAWRSLQTAAEQVVGRLYSAGITWLTAEELDARAQQELSR